MSQPDLFSHADHVGRLAAIRDLLESPRHNIDAKGRAWLRRELRDEMALSTSTASPSSPNGQVPGMTNSQGPTHDQ